MSHPAIRTGLRPYRSDRVPAKKFVAALTAPNATINVERRGERGEPELLFGEQREHRAFLADHPTDERVDADEQGELGDVLAQAEADRVLRWVEVIGRCSAGSRSALFKDILE